jgi:hypothetical protein
MEMMAGWPLIAGFGLLGVGLATVFDPLKTVQATESEVRFYLLG